MWQFLLHVAPYYEQFALNYRERIRDLGENDTLKLDDVIAALLDEQISGENAKAAANFARFGSNKRGQNQKKNGKSSKKDDKDSCNICGLSNHDESQCWHKDDPPLQEG